MDRLLRPVIGSSEIKHSMVTLKELLTADSIRFRRKVSSRGGSKEWDIFWQEELHFWSHIEPEIKKRQYRCVFGVTDPNARAVLSMTVQFNLPMKGKNIRRAGRFVQDERGKIWLAQSGNVSPGVRGGGRSMFRKLYRAQGGAYPTKRVKWPGGRNRSLILVTALDDPRAARKIGRFVHEVDRIKEKIKRGTADEEMLT
jgi:hypothetical protein